MLQNIIFNTKSRQCEKIYCIELKIEMPANIVYMIHSGLVSIRLAEMKLSEHVIRTLRNLQLPRTLMFTRHKGPIESIHTKGPMRS